MTIGASGSQGGEVLKLLQKQNKFKLRVLQRKESDFAKKVREEGVEVAIGDLYDEPSLVKAMKDVYGVFSVLAISVNMKEEDEETQEKNIVSAAKKNDVQILIHVSVARAGDEESFVDWNDEDRTPVYHMYWKGKTRANNVVKNSNIPHWVIFKPAMMMDNFLKGRALIYPTLKEGYIENNVKLDTKIDFICALDQGKFVADAFENIEKYDKKEIDLASQSLTLTEVADIIFKCLNKKIKIISTDAKELNKNTFIKQLLIVLNGIILKDIKLILKKLNLMVLN